MKNLFDLPEAIRTTILQGAVGVLSDSADMSHLLQKAKQLIDHDFESKPDIEAIARITYNVNRAYCLSIGDDSFSSWDEAPAWQKDANIRGVEFHLEGDHKPEDSHNSWLAQKEADGWSYGEVKDPENKLHPCYLPYDQLPFEQKIKDYLFIAVVHSFK